VSDTTRRLVLVSPCSEKRGQEYFLLSSKRVVDFFHNAEKLVLEKICRKYEIFCEFDKTQLNIIEESY
jgi:hypothetical protein